MTSRALTYLRLGRVSNLPTVWSNVVAGAALAGGPVDATRTIPIAVAASAFYVGGMFLNDAFDRHVDARDRPERPIPAGLVSAAEVFGIGFGLLAVGLAIIALIAWQTSIGAAPVGGAVALALAIVLYDFWHKDNPLSPVLMGICRMLVYVTAALAATGRLTGALWGGALALLSYLIGLTYAAKHETGSRRMRVWPLAFLAAPLAYAPLVGGASTLVIALSVVLATWIAWSVMILRSGAKGSIPRGVVSLIAGISLVDALFAAASGAPLGAVGALAAFPLTLALQRYVAGT